MRYPRLLHDETFTCLPQRLQVACMLDVLDVLDFGVGVLDFGVDVLAVFAFASMLRSVETI